MVLRQIVLVGSIFADLSNSFVRARAPIIEPKTTTYIEAPNQDCFLEGLYFRDNRTLVQSCGLWKKSKLQEMKIVHKLGSSPAASSPDVATTHRIHQTKVAKLESDVFGEGTVDLFGRTYSLTYQKRRVDIYDKRSWKKKGTLKWPHGQGWGLTTDGCRLIGTTGDDHLYIINPKDGSLLQKIAVTDGVTGLPQRMLNEVEFVAPHTVWVNIWQTNLVGRIGNMWTGQIDKYIRLSKSWHGEATPNGIAYNYEFNKNSLICTGKLWETMFNFELKTEDLCDAEGVSSARKLDLDGKQDSNADLDSSKTTSRQESTFPDLKLLDDAQVFASNDQVSDTEVIRWAAESSESDRRTDSDGTGLLEITAEMVPAGQLQCPYTPASPCFPKGTRINFADDLWGGMKPLSGGKDSAAPAAKPLAPAAATPAKPTIPITAPTRPTPATPTLPTVPNTINTVPAASINPLSEVRVAEDTELQTRRTYGALVSTLQYLCIFAAGNLYLTCLIKLMHMKKCCDLEAGY